MTKRGKHWLVLDGLWLLAAIALVLLWLPPSTVSIYERGNESFELSLGLFHWLSVGYEATSEGVKAWSWQIVPKPFLGTVALSALAFWVLVRRRSKVTIHRSSTAPA